MRKAFVALAASVLAIGSASAQEVYVDDLYDLEEETVIEEPMLDEPALEAPEPVEPGPRVYGWEAAVPPTSCGTYKYWNGSYCADARTEPPVTD